jgi:hypothetical protein
LKKWLFKLIYACEFYACEFYAYEFYVYEIYVPLFPVAEEGQVLKDHNQEEEEVHLFPTVLLPLCLEEDEQYVVGCPVFLVEGPMVVEAFLIINA